MSGHLPLRQQIDSVFKSLFALPDPSALHAEQLRMLCEVVYENGRESERRDRKAFESWVISGQHGDVPAPTVNPYKKVDTPQKA